MGNFVLVEVADMMKFGNNIGIFGIRTHGGEGVGDDALHLFVAEHIDEVGLRSGGLQPINGVVQIEIALTHEAGSRLGAREKDHQRVCLSGGVGRERGHYSTLSSSSDEA